MRRSLACAFAALLAAPSFVHAFSGPTAVKSGPAIVPYLCSGGETATVVYESGSDYQHARARLTYGGETLDLRAAPTLYGVRYRSAAAESGPARAWSLRGEEAWLTESPDEESYTRQEQAIARCVRLRGAAPVAASDSGHDEGHDGHGEGHSEDH